MLNLAPIKRKATPPEGAAYVEVQFLAQHEEVFKETALYEISGFQLWAEDTSIGIDAVVVLQTDSITDWHNSSAWLPETERRELEIEHSRGKRTITLAKGEQDHRIQFFESPIHHWVFQTETERQPAYALNGLSFGLTLPSETESIKASVPLNTTWNRGIVFLLLGILIIVWLSVKIEQEQYSLQKL